MINGDPICTHNLYLVHCRTCRMAADHAPSFDRSESRAVTWIRSVGNEKIIGVSVNGRIHFFEDDMKKHNPEPGFNVIAEHQARLEWEERTKTVTDLRRTFLALPTELKREVLQDICMYCFRESREPCHCENDE